MNQELCDKQGRRKYFTSDERESFLETSSKAAREVRTFCNILLYTGCRISEALALTTKDTDLSAKVIVFESLKKRRSGVYRQVPIPAELLDLLDMVHGIREIQKKGRTGQPERLWPWCRMTAWRKVEAVIKDAGITDGPHASPKGLRHGFGIAAVSKGVALNMLQKWLGHSQMTTTAIYANASGVEERSIAARMWA
jgi:integrase/recombinase XerD